MNSESLLRKSYLKQCYEIVMNKMKERLIGRKLRVSIDETVDSCTDQLPIVLLEFYHQIKNNVRLI